MNARKSNKKTSVKKKTKVAPPKDELLLELDGKVYTVEKKNGKVVAREELDGNVVLQCILRCLEQGLDLVDAENKE